MFRTKFENKSNPENTNRTEKQVDLMTGSVDFFDEDSFGGDDGGAGGSRARLRDPGDVGGA